MAVSTNDGKFMKNYITNIFSHNKQDEIPCTSNEQCGGNHALCDTNSNICRCELGYVPYLIDNKFVCYLNACKDDQECDALIPNSICNNENNCVCKSSYQHDLTTHSCVPKYLFIGDICLYSETNSSKNNKNCGLNALCTVGSRCKCKMGSLPSLDNKMDCTPFECIVNSDCSLWFGESVCINRQCECMHGYVVNSFYQVCGNYEPGDEDDSILYIIICFLASIFVITFLIWLGSYLFCLWPFYCCCSGTKPRQQHQEQQQQQQRTSTNINNNNNNNNSPSVNLRQTQIQQIERISDILPLATIYPALSSRQNNNNNFNENKLYPDFKFDPPPPYTP